MPRNGRSKHEHGQQYVCNLFGHLQRCQMPDIPCPSLPCFFGIPCLFRWRGIIFFFVRAFFPSFPGILGVRRVKKSLFFGGFSLPFSKKTRKDRVENSRRVPCGCRVGHGKTAEEQPEKQPKHPKNSCFDCFSGVSAVFPAVFRLFYRVGHLAPL